ncbi:MAG: tetratricopeptide repeat protein, partial [Nitrososphaeraceae archaeon]
LVHVGLTQLWSFLNPTQAKQIFEEAQELSENNPRVHSAKGEYYLSNGEYEAAMKCFKKSIACDRTTAWAYVGIAECYEGQNDLLAAEEYYRTAIRTAPDYHWSYIKFCNFYGRPEFFSEHEEDILTLLKLMYTVYPDNKYGAFLEAARIYRKNGKYGPAHEWVDKAIELKRVPFEAYIEKGYLYFINGEYDKSRNMFLLAVEKAPNTFDGYWWLAWFHESLGNWEEALEWYGKCLERREQWKARILNKISTMNWRLKRYSLAEKQIIKALELERDDPAINNAVSKMAYQYSTTLESTEKAASLYKKILDLRGHSYKAEYHHNMAFLLTFSKNWDEARKEAEQAYKTDRDKDLYEKHLADIANQEGTSYVAEERIDEAEKKFGEALLLYDSILTRDHDNVDSWIGKGHVLYNLEKYDGAINSYNEALKKGVISPFIWKNKGDCYSIIDKMEQAIECYDKAIEIDAEFTEALTNKGEVLFSLHRYEHALKTYDRILEIDSRNAIAWYNKASILSILGRHEQALEALDRVLEINPRDIDAIINRGLELHDLGRNDKALATFDKALKIDPNDYFALNNKAWVLAKINKPEEALAVINKALDIAPNFDSALDTKGFILYELKQYKEALRFIEAALAVNSDIALRWKHKGLILDQLGKNKLAQNSYMMAQQIDNSR